MHNIEINLDKDQLLDIATYIYVEGIVPFGKPATWLKATYADTTVSVLVKQGSDTLLSEDEAKGELATKLMTALSTRSRRWRFIFRSWISDRL